MVLHGRKAELAEIEGLLGRATAGMSSALVVRGPAGIGKTVLLEHAIRMAAEFQVTRVAGAEVEQELGYAGLHRLLLPFLGERGRLPAPQRDALETAFGLSPAAPPAAAPPDRFLVGLAALTLLADAAAERRLLAICDDAQWLDRESLQVLAFVGRRLHADGIVLLFGAREDDCTETDLRGLAEMRLEGLLDQDARALFDALTKTRADPVIVARLLAETGGNPLAIGELARALARDPAAVPTGFGEPLPLDYRMERRFLRQVGDLDSLTQLALLVLAAETSGDMDLVRGAIATLASVTPDQIDAAVGCARQEDLVGPGAAPGRVEFRHPLIRSAVYRSAPPALRRHAHAALAATTDPIRDPDRRAWHRAAAAAASDLDVAAQLEASADRARERGGYLAQAAFLHRAAELTPAGPERNGRLLEASAAALTAGAPQRAEELLSLLTPDLGVARQDAYAMRLRGFLRVMLGRQGAVALLLEAATILARSDPAAGRDTLLEALDAATVVVRIGPGMSILLVAQAALDLAPPPGDLAVADVLLAAHAELVAHGYVRALPLMRDGLEAMRAEGAETGDAARWFLLGVLLAVELWDIDSLGACSMRYAAAARRQGALRMLQASVSAMAIYEILCGRTAAAEAHFAEFKDVAAAIGADMTLAGAGDVLLHGWRGDRERTIAAAAARTGVGEERPGGIQVQLARTAVTWLELGHRRYAAAQAAAQLIYDQDPPHIGGIALPDLVEAAARNNDTVTAGGALARLSERATAAGTPWALGVVARSRALLTNDDSAEELYLRAIALLEQADVATETARGHLLYGEWLRRRRRRLDAREQLRHAYEMFSSMGAAAFAERARTELEATGEHARERSPTTLHDLTLQELRVARLAASGTTNQQIAAELFISTSTVEYHLRKAFRKLGIASRRQLPDALPP